MGRLTRARRPEQAEAVRTLTVEVLRLRRELQIASAERDSALNMAKLSDAALTALGKGPFLWDVASQPGPSIPEVTSNVDGSTWVRELDDDGRVIWRCAGRDPEDWRTLIYRLGPVRASDTTLGLI